MCRECVAHPSGLAGHDFLFLFTAEIGEDPVFVCASCATRWRRRYVGQGTFSWTPPTDSGDEP